MELGEIEKRFDLLEKREEHEILFGLGEPSTQSHDPTFYFSQYMHGTAHGSIARQELASAVFPNACCQRPGFRYHLGRSAPLS